MWREVIIAIVVCMAMFGAGLILTGCDGDERTSITGVPSPITANDINNPEQTTDEAPGESSEDAPGKSDEDHGKGHAYGKGKKGG